MWLIAWTQWLVDRYGLAQDLGSCWPAHPALVGELTALAESWHHAYSRKADPHTTVRWHEALQPARHRWQGWDIIRCRQRQHTPPGSADTVWSPPWPTDAERAVTDDVNARQRAVAARTAGGVLLVGWSWPKWGPVWGLLLSNLLNPCPVWAAGRLWAAAPEPDAAARSRRCRGFVAVVHESVRRCVRD